MSSSDRPSVLVIEDDPGIQRLIPELLKRLHVRTDVASNGFEALELVRTRPYQLIVLDLRMPVMDGVAFAREIAAISPGLLDRILVVTALSEGEIAKSFGDALSLLRLPIMQKPFELPAFMAVVSRYLDTEAAAVNSDFREASCRIGAKAGVLVVPGANGVTLDLVCAFGYPTGMAEGYFPLNINKPFPICHTFRTGKPVWVASLLTAVSDYPLLAPIWEKEKNFALAALPIKHRNAVIGAAGWSFAEPQRFDPAQQRRLLAIANRYRDRVARLSRSSVATGAARA